MLDNHVGGDASSWRAGRRGRGAAAGPRALAGELQRHRPAAQRRRRRGDHPRRSTAIGVPILVGAVLEQPAGRLSNVTIVWRPRGSAHPGRGRRYVKRHPVPFGEYIPYRSFFRPVQPRGRPGRARTSLAGRPGRRADRRSGARLGDLICFEVAYDDLVRDAVRGGAQLLVVQTNNATFGYTDETEQQLAMSRLRAVETRPLGRARLDRRGQRPDRPRRHGRCSAPGCSRQRRAAGAPAAARAADPVATRVGAWPEAADRRRRPGPGRRWPAARAGAQRPARPRAAAAADPRPERPPPPRGRRGLGRVLVVIPTYNERENLAADRAPGCAPPYPAPTSWWSTTAQPGRHRRDRRRAGRRRRPRARPAPAAARQGLGAAYLAGFGWGAASAATTCSSRWTPTARTSPSSCRRCSSGRSPAPTWSSARGGCPAARWSTGRCPASCSARGGNLYTRLLLGMPLRDATGGYRVYRALGAGASSTSTTSPRQGYCFQVDLVWRAVRPGLRVREVPITFVERELGEQQDERRDRRARRCGGSPGGACGSGWSPARCRAARCRAAPGRPA